MIKKYRDKKKKTLFTNDNFFIKVHKVQSFGESLTQTSHVLWHVQVVQGPAKRRIETVRAHIQKVISIFHSDDQAEIFGAKI